MDEKLHSNNAADLLHQACVLLDVPVESPERITGARATRLIAECLLVLARAKVQEK